MWRVAALFWVFIAPVAAGVLVLAAMMAPGLQDQLGKWIVGAALAGFAAAIPIARTVAKSFARQTA